MSALRTRCPSCGTTFRVGPEQLSAAQGLVRCGACETVFDAAAERVDEAAAEEPRGTRGIDEDYIAELLSASPPPPPDQQPEAPGPLAPITPPAPMPVELALPVDDAAARRRRIGWLAACALAALALLLQYAWLTRAEHAQDPRWRRHYEAACAWLGCRVPPYRDHARIRSEGLVVRPDPDRSGVLLLDAVLINTAPFPQAFPGLELRFSDIRGQAVAARVFLPGEYLGGAALREGTMPPREPLRVHLELKDPGEHATNYELRLEELPPD